jgi:hypothetical protein
MSPLPNDNALCIERQSIIAIPARRASKDSSELTFEASDDDLGLFDLIDEDTYWEADATVDASTERKPRAIRRMSITASSSFNQKVKSGSSVCSSRSNRSGLSRGIRATKSNDLDAMSISMKSQMSISSNDSDSSSPRLHKAKPIRKIEFAVNNNA